jgi:gas vesicle protein
MSREPEAPHPPPGEPPETGRSWDATSFLTGMLLGAAVGAGIALLLAPAAGEDTRRLIRGRARAVTRDAAEGWVTTRDQARQALREKKAALRERLAKGVEQVGEELGI